MKKFSKAKFSKATLSLLLFSVPVFLSACADPLADPISPPTPKTGSKESTPQPAVMLRSASQKPSSPITLSFAGDVHGEGVIAARLKDPKTVFGPIDKVLKDSDFAMVNLETAVTARGVKEPKKYNFRTSPQIFAAMKSSGIDVATLANNHGVDYGREGLLDTLQAEKDSGFPLVGVGKNKTEAFAPWRTSIKGTSIAVFGATQVLDSFALKSWPATASSPGLASAYDEKALLDAIKKETKTSDVVVVYLHWGIEKQSCPSPKAKDLANKLANAGAKIVVGSHAHVLLGDGFLGKTYVDYGLGNFLWYTSGAPTGVLTLSVDSTSKEVIKSSFTPAVVENGRPVPVKPSGAQREKLRACAKLTAS